ncbi:MAG: RNA 3'-terminal phosphate cyclase, partial [Planctomycetota bacterium]
MSESTSNETVVLDGRQGEGGGQVLRTSLSLAAALGRPVVVENVRGGRRKPGLLRQHRTALRAVRDITAGEVEGDELGSTSVRFTPGGPPLGGKYRFGIGSAGSTMLVLQTVLPPLLRAHEPSTVVLEGGTHNPSAPPFEFLDEAFLPCVRAMGAEATARLVRPGYFPGGGGELMVEVAPAAERRRLKLLAREDAGTPSVEVVVDGLPADIAEREWKAFRRKLHWTRDRLRVSEAKAGRSPGNVMIA